MMDQETSDEVVLCGRNYFRQLKDYISLTIGLSNAEQNIYRSKDLRLRRTRVQSAISVNLEQPCNK